MEFQSAQPPQSRFWFSKQPRNHDTRRSLNKTTLLSSLAIGLLASTFWVVIQRINFASNTFPSWVIQAGIGTNFSFQLLYLASFITSTVGIYLLCQYLTRRQVTSLISAVIYLVPLSAIYISFLMNNSSVHIENVKSFMTIIYGDGSRIMAMALVPCAVLFYLKYLKWGNGIDLLVSILTCSFVFLTFGPLSPNLIIVLTVCTLTELFLGNWKRKLRRSLEVILLSFGLISFWYTPMYWFTDLNTIFAQIVRNVNLLPLTLILAAIAFIFSYVVFSRNESRQPIFISFLTFIIFFSTIADWFTNGNSFLSYPHRIVPSLVMFGTLVFAQLATMLLDRLSLEKRLVATGFQMSHGAGHIGGIIVFGIFSFITFSIVAYAISPLALWAVSGPAGIWLKINSHIIGDAGLNIASGFNSQLQGITISAICLVYLLFVFFKKAFKA